MLVRSVVVRVGVQEEQGNGTVCLEGLADLMDMDWTGWRGVEVAGQYRALSCLRIDEVYSYAGVVKLRHSCPAVMSVGDEVRIAVNAFANEVYVCVRVRMGLLRFWWIMGLSTVYCKCAIGSCKVHDDDPYRLID